MWLKSSAKYPLALCYSPIPIFFWWASFCTPTPLSCEQCFQHGWLAAKTQEERGRSIREKQFSAPFHHVNVAHPLLSFERTATQELLQLVGTLEILTPGKAVSSPLQPLVSQARGLLLLLPFPSLPLIPSCFHMNAKTPPWSYVAIINRVNALELPHLTLMHLNRNQ